MQWYKVLKSFVLIAGIAVAVFFYARYHLPPSIALPSLALTDMDGRAVNLDAYQGKPILVSYFATWCGPCIKELPEFLKLAENLHDLGLAVICISDEPLALITPLQKRFGTQIIFLHSNLAFHDINIYTYPTNYIYNARGVKVYNKVNPEDWSTSEMQAKVRDLIAP